MVSNGNPSSYPHGTFILFEKKKKTIVLNRLTQPLRTVMNYQYRYGTTTTQAIHILYEDGGWTRYYQGLTAALVQGPVSRFGDTAANTGILALLKSNPYMKKLPLWIQTIFGSFAAAAFRMILTPVDTLKTTLQTQGRPGIQILRSRVIFYSLLTVSLLHGILIFFFFFGNYRSKCMASELYGTAPLRLQQPPSSGTTQSVMFLMIYYK